MTLLTQARLGCEPWTVYITARGSDKPILEVPGYLNEFSRELNAISEARVTLPNDFAKNTYCCEVLAKTEPFAHELSVWRGDQIVWNGPVWDVLIEQGDAVIQARDIFSWLERRFVEEDLSLSGDGSDVFRRLLEIGYGPDDSSNPAFVFKESGVWVERRYMNVQFSRVADLLQELSRSAVDYTTIKRLIMFGARRDSQQGQKRLVLHDEGVLGARVEKTGASFATDIAVFGSTPPKADQPVFGRAKRGIDFYGLVQDSKADLYIQDSTSANENALGRVLMLHPAPRRLKCSLSEDAAMGFEELVPGSWIEVRLDQVLGCEKGIHDLMRLDVVRAAQQVNPGGGQREVVDLEMAPLGLIGEAE